MRSEELAYWINEREQIRVNKEEKGLAPPWTEDVWLANYRFCNVRREDDKVTRWLRKNWSARRGEDPNILLAMTLGRFVNRIESLEKLGYPEHGLNEEKFLKVAHESKPFWGNAYTISTCGAAMSKPEYVLTVLRNVEYFQPIFHAACHTNPDMSHAHGYLTNTYGIGDFLAAQILADLKWTQGHPLGTAWGRATWAAPGPGSKRGLERFYSGAKGTFLPRLQAAAVAVQPLIDPNLWEANLHRMDMQDWQNCMCEFDKFQRLKEGGHVRNGYRPAP
jgi:hypothetical protein